MAKVDLSKFIVKATTKETYLRNGKTVEIETDDLICCDRYGEFSYEFPAKVNGYSLANGSVLRINSKNQAFAPYWCALTIPYDLGGGVTGFAREYGTPNVKDVGLGLCPVMALDVGAVVEAKKRWELFGKISQPRDANYHTIEFGEYPQTEIPDSSLMEDLHSACLVQPTGKSYLGRYRISMCDFDKNVEYDYKGEKYVRVPKVQGRFIAKGAPVAYQWFKVEPIKWKIINWDELPTSINPEGKGTATKMRLMSESVLTGTVPFNISPNSNVDKETIAYYKDIWAYSTIRSYLNGINVGCIVTSQASGYGIQMNIGGDCRGKGFIQEAFSVDEKHLTRNVSQEYDGRKSKIAKMNPDRTPVKYRRQMTDTEIIQNWVDSGQSVLLRGPSGIGKTARLKQLYPDLIYIKLTNNMFPEKVVGSMNLQTGQVIPPNFAKQAILACATDEERKLISENIQNLFDLSETIYERSKTADGKVVILLDELLNVKPAVQSLVYTLVLNKIVETGKGLKLPANTVVVATGNQKKYSLVAEDLAEPLEKRFDHILDMEPKVSEWLSEFAVPNKIHPAVIGYVFSKYQENGYSDKLKDIGYFYEEPEVAELHIDKNGCRGRTNDPRGWESISNMLYSFEDDLTSGRLVGKDVENLLQTSIGSKLRDEWASEFFDFYNHPTLSVEEVLSGKYSEEDLPHNISEKFGAMAGLLGASPEEVSACRDFVRQHCDPEYVQIYDIYWAGTNAERMEQIAELREMERTKTSEGAEKC